MSASRVGPSARSAGGAGILLLAALLLGLALQMGPSPIADEAGPSYRAMSLPQVLVLQPDGVNGTDAMILDVTPTWNYGDNASLWVGPDVANASLARSLLLFNFSALPAGSYILNATLEMYQYAGGMGTVALRRAQAPWNEGTGERSWTSVPIVVRETSGQRRVNEPVSAALAFPPYGIGLPMRDLRLYLGAAEVPSQVSALTFTGGWVTGAQVVFPASMAAAESKVYTVAYSTNGTSVPAYRTKTFGASSLWTSPAVGSGASGVSVVDVDGDGALEILYGTQDGFVYALNVTGGTEWSRSVTATRSVPYGPQVADLEGDGQLDVVVMTNEPSIVRLDAATGAIRWSIPIGLPDLPLSTPTLLDVNGDGVLDALIGGRNRQVDAYSGVDGALLASYPAGDWAYTASVHDVDGDGQGEIFFASDDFLVYAYNASDPVTPLWATSPLGTSFIENSVAVGDVDNDGYVDIVTGDDMQNGGEFAINATSGAITWSTSLPSYREGGQTLADLDGDGTLETLVGLLSGEMYALRGLDGVVSWTYPGVGVQASAPAVVDLTNDGIPEILFYDGDAAIIVLDATGALVHQWAIAPNDPGFRNLSQKRMDTPAVVDLDGDGTLEVIAATGVGIQVFPTGGLARDWRTFGYNWNHTHRAGDGTSPEGVPFLEVSVGAATVHPGAGVSWRFRDGSVPWASFGGDFGPSEATATVSPGAWASWNITAMVADWFNDTSPNVGLVATEVDEVSGTAHAFFSSDAPVASLRPKLTITYTAPVSDPVPRILAAIPDVTRSEDGPPWSLDLSGYAYDEDTPAMDLRWNVSGYDPAILHVTGTNLPGGSVLTFYLHPDAWGDMYVTYWLTDPQGNTANRNAWIHVTPVNDPPTFSPPATLVVRADVPYAFDFGPYIADVDNPPPTLALASDDPLHVSVTGLNATFLFPATYLGQWAFVGFVVNDGSSSVGRVVAVKVSSDNPPEVRRPMPDLTMIEGQLLRAAFDLDDYFTDPNNDVLFFSYGYTHLMITIHPNHTVDIQGETNWFGAEQVTFRGTDPEGALAEDTIVVTVLPVDDPPVLGPVPDLRVRYDAPYPFNLDPYISDPDTPNDRINASASSPYVTVSAHLLSLLYPFALNGSVQPLTLWISDGVSVASRTINVTVGEDWPPVVQLKMPDRAFPEDAVLPGAYNLSAHFDDPDGTALYYSTGNVNVRVSIDGGGQVSLSADPDWFGTERVSFRARDPEGAIAEDTVWISVLPVNDAPAIAPIPTIYLNSSAGFVDLLPYLSDVDTNVTGLLLTTSSPNATVVGHGILFRYPGDATEDVQVVVSDGELTGGQVVRVVVRIPRETQVVPAWLFWLLGWMAVASLAGLIIYRYHQVEWAFLVTNGGLLVSSISRAGSSSIDTDLMMSMLTAIMDFAKKSFSDETKGGLEGLEMGDRRVIIVRGERGFLAAVYRGRTPGSLHRTMTSLLRYIEARHPQVMDDIVDSTTLEDIPFLLKRFVDYAWWPFLTFGDPDEGREAPAS